MQGINYFCLTSLIFKGVNRACRDKKKAHTHIARKTFATTVLLLNGVSMEVVSELLGHSKITVTQEHYAKVVKSKVSEEVNKLKNSLK